MCCDMIRKSGIKTIMYSDEKGSIIKIKHQDLDDSHVSKGNKRIPPEFEEYFRRKLRRIKRSIGRSIHLT